MMEREQQAKGDIREIVFNISGMSCHGCAQALSMLLRQQHGVTNAEADSKSGKVRVTLNGNVDQSELIARIQSAGYDVQ